MEHSTKWLAVENADVGTADEITLSLTITSFLRDVGITMI